MITKYDDKYSIELVHSIYLETTPLLEREFVWSLPTNNPLIHILGKKIAVEWNLKENPKTKYFGRILAKRPMGWV